MSAGAMDHFWQDVSVQGDCWIWGGGCDEDGYGFTTINGRRLRCHRVSFEYFYGQIPDGLLLDHKCHNAPCVRPEHLRPATHKQNMENRSGANIHAASGIRGVGWHKHSGLWQARVGHNGARVIVGYFADPRDAEAAVIAKRNELYTHNILDRPATSAAAAMFTLPVVAPKPVKNTPTADSRCGTRAGYQRHSRRYEKPCQPCKAGEASYRRERTHRNALEVAA